MSGGLGVWGPVIVGPRTPHADAAIVRGREDVGVVGGDGVDGGVVGLHLPDQGACLGVPELDGAGPAARDNNVPPGEICEAAYPVFVSVVETLDELLAPEVPLLDAGVSGGGPEGVPLHRHALDAVIVRRVQGHLGGDHPALVVRDIKHLDVVILAAGDDVVLVQGLIARSDGEAHDGCLVTPGQLPDAVELP